MTAPRAKRGQGKRVSRKTGDALIVLDVINDLAFDGGEKLFPWALKMAPVLAGFKRRAHAHGMPVVHVNDNFGEWRSNFSDLYRYCTRKGARGREVSRKLRPRRDDYFILKPRHSAFYATSLVPLLEHLQARRLILSGLATNLCVLFTAHDAHMRQFELVVLSDCCAAESDFDHNTALEQLKRFCGATICRNSEFQFI